MHRLVASPLCYRPFSLPGQLIRNAVTGRHSKKVASTKNRLDAAKTKLYNRIAIKIINCVRTGGSNTNLNPNLTRILREAQAANVPKDNIERAINKGDSKDAVALEKCKFELYLFGGVGAIVTAETDSTTRTNKKINEIAGKTGIKVANKGSIEFQFNHKGVFTPSDPQLLLDKAKEEAILEMALENEIDIDFYSHGDAPKILSSVEDLHKLTDVLFTNNINGVSSLEYIPQELIAVTEDIYEQNMKVIERFLDEPDVDEVFTNISS